VVLGALPPRARMRQEPGEIVELQGPLRSVLRALAKRGITSVLVEGGAHVHGEFLRRGLWDELRLFIAPRIAGADALSWAGFAGKRRMQDALQATLKDIHRIGPDVLMVLRPKQ
ncbi:MAG TPA: dihydrofolate reductase family protein, partial [Myxococcales bacterium]